jgi:inner membrane protein
MLIFGHAGITLGAAALTAGALSRRNKSTATKSWFSALINSLDIRLLLIGSLLPDIIDKPLGIYILHLQNGRVYAHTLLFLLVIGGAGYYLYRSRKLAWLLTLAAGTLAHLIQDKMWSVPGTLFWPLMGLSFPREILNEYFAGLFKKIFTNRYIFTTELIGLVVIVWFGVWLIYRRQTGAFIRRGKIL